MFLLVPGGLGVGVKGHRSASVLDGTAFGHHCNGNPVSRYRDVVVLFVGLKADAGVELRGGEIVSACEVILEGFMWENS